VSVAANFGPEAPPAFHLLAKLTVLLAQGRAPAEVMERYAALDAQRGRNDPCTCGSGRQWKRCHGDAVRLEAVR
jgi:uncharacterized protein YecA (UPF0149 family)